MSDENERSVASAGSTAGDVVEHAKKCVGFWRSMMEEADRIGMEHPSLAIGGVTDLVDGLLAEITRLRITDAEREFLHALRNAYEESANQTGYVNAAAQADSRKNASIISGLLDRNRTSSYTASPTAGGEVNVEVPRE